MYFGMGCQKELDRHVTTPPYFFATFGLDVNLTRSFPERKSVIERKINLFILFSPFAWH